MCRAAIRCFKLKQKLQHRSMHFIHCHDLCGLYFNVIVSSETTTSRLKKLERQNERKAVESPTDILVHVYLFYDYVWIGDDDIYIVYVGFLACSSARTACLRIAGNHAWIIHLVVPYWCYVRLVGLRNAFAHHCGLGFRFDKKTQSWAVMKPSPPGQRRLS